MGTQLQEYQPDIRLVQAIEHIVSEAWNTPVHLGDWEELRRNRVYRVAVIAPTTPDGTAVPASIIIKKARPEPNHPYDPDAFEWNPAWRFLEDWAGVQFLSSLRSTIRHSPRFIGGDRRIGVFVMEDVGRGETLAEHLMGNNPRRAEETLWRYAEALGSLHADTHRPAK